MGIKSYRAAIRSGLMEHLESRLGLFTAMFGNMVYLVIIFFLWRAIYDSASSATVGGMTFYDTMIYLVLSNAMFSFMESYVVSDMGDDIRTGKIINDIIKPIPYREFKFFNYIGKAAMAFLTVYMPTFVLVALLSDGRMRFGLNLLLYLISMFIGLCINYLIEFITGTLCLYTESVWGINIMKEVIVLLFSGAVIPLAFFPKVLKHTADFLPFRGIYNIPLRFLVEQELQQKEIFSLFLYQLLWMCVLFLISSWFWKKSFSKITLNGG